MKTRKAFSRRKEATADVVAAPVRFVEVARAPLAAQASADGYELSWPSGMRLQVPRGFCPEEVAMLLELLREGGPE